jgi:hypothetical protein
MTYRERLYCWAIARLLPNQQWIIIARFRSRSDAEGHFHFLRRNTANVQLKVVFDMQTEQLSLARAGDRT